MRRPWISGFVAGCLTTALLVLGASHLPWPPPVEAQLPESPHEQIQIMREMSGSLKGIEQALQEIARKP